MKKTNIESSGWIHLNIAVTNQRSRWNMASVLFHTQSAGDTGDNSTTGCLSKFPAVVVYGEHRSGCDYYNGDSKSWRSVRLICGRGKKKKRPGPFFMESQLTTKDTFTHVKEHFGGAELEKRSSHKNGKRNLLLFSAHAIICNIRCLNKALGHCKMHKQLNQT